jgi:hypothetical protein
MTSYSGSSDATALNKLETLTNDGQEKDKKIGDLLQEITSLKVIID